MSPFDTRFELGLSIRQKELEVYLFVDNLDDAELKAICKVIFKEMRKNDLITLTLGSYQRYGDRNQMIENMLEEMTEHYVPKEEIPEEDQLPDKVVEEEEPRAKFLIIKEENDVIAAFKTSRIIVDMGMKPDLYHQIAAISSGIPQINQVQTDYVTHKENGYIVEDIKGIEKGLSYFFKGLSHWNRSLVYSIEKIAENTGPALIDKWKNQGEGQITDDRS
ncbi:accessory Sec system protein Asp1 [Streptococcus penaeicida]|uniref:accessory Sec system protein Asp1 n=1 Tax=Streptococcus penaeicida TaxID=1765960 RepID=UPI002481DCF3|nr:accessory Sec system protein Asp1 [Streptococcus penaeicida]